MAQNKKRDHYAVKTTGEENVLKHFYDGISERLEETSL